MEFQQVPPGPIGLFGSGEATTSGGLIFDVLARDLSAPLIAAFLETPAGFELNSPKVVGRVADYVTTRLQNYKPEVRIVAARKKGTAFSPDNLEIIRPLMDANLIFLGPGSPTYAVRHLKDTLAWQAVQARHRLGAALALASAAAIAVGTLALPVYEIYKAGEDPHWKEGLNLLGPYGLRLVFIPHWNNAEGGPELDTSHCFMGSSRFEALRDSLPGGETIVGIDENTGLIIDLSKQSCRAVGKGTITVSRDGVESQFPHGKSFPLLALGEMKLPEIDSGIPPAIWQAIKESATRRAQPRPPAEVQSLVLQRDEARMRRDWTRADELRIRILNLGWVVSDTAHGSQLRPSDLKES